MAASRRHDDYDYALESQRLEQRLELARDTVSLPMVFIVGCQKSGTTWMQRILDAHPDIRCHGETIFGPILMPMLRDLVRTHNAKHKAGPVSDLDTDDARTLFRVAVGLCMRRWVGDRSVKMIGEKTPEHAMCMESLHGCFPQAKFIHVVRDGRDVCVSGWYHNLRQPNAAEFRERFPTINDYIAYTVRDHWVPYITKARQFAGKHPELFHEVRYESLHDSPKQTIAEVMDFLGMSYTPEIIEHCQGAASFETLTGGRQPGEEDRESHYRKGIVGDWQTTLNASDLQTFKTLGSRMMQELGYAA